MAPAILEAAAAAAAAAILAALVAGRGFQRAVVEGDSMRPALEPGDRLVVVRSRRVRPGQVVVIADPRRPERLLVKRLTAAGPAGVRVRGDNDGASTDSREFGAVAPTAIVGRAIYRYAPSARAGPIRADR